MELGQLLPPQATIFALPNADQAKLYVVGTTSAQRWKKSSLYPAFRLSAKIHRLFVRVRAATGYVSSWSNQISQWVVEEFVHDRLPNLDSCVVLVGAPGPTQKLIVELWDRDKIIGYIKYAEAPRARALLEREFCLLTRLPQEFGPAVKKYGPMGDGLALLTSPIQGQRLTSTLPISDQVLELLQTFETPDLRNLAIHPMLQFYQTPSHQCTHSWLDILSSREWPVTFHHGDFTPWNIICGENGKLVAIDWEYGHEEGFPLLDSIHYIFQIARLIYFWSPEKTKSYTMKILTQSKKYLLSSAEAEALIKLTAYQDFLVGSEDGHSSTTPPQVWRKKLWEL